MGRRKATPQFQASSVLCGSFVLLAMTSGPVSGLADAAADRFQAALQQQSMFSILTSIEERLQSLDNIYSMQLSKTLETKLDQYSRRLEALDNKIIRLEALVMLNLDKISENISTKNFKDDMSRTSLFRKMDSVYESVNHRLGYMERKYEASMIKMQTKVDTTLTRLEKIEETITTRDSDMEEEISDVIFALDELKATCATMEEKLYKNISATFNVTVKSFKFMQDMNVDSRKSMNVLHDNIIGTLQYMNNKTVRHMKLVEDSHFLLKAMKTDLKEDFNEYANKVADMNSYIWKNVDNIEGDLQRIETIGNSTKIELQNGVRSLMVQIGTISSKDNILPSDEVARGNAIEELDKKLNANFERILTNQDLFLESCHRLQMDESQIESEISNMLEKLINMLEKRMGSEMKDIKNLEKLVKAHDSRMMRNIHQINGNLMSLFKKTTTNTEGLLREIRNIGGDLNALFAFLQSTISTERSILISPKEIQAKLDKLENLVHAQRQPNSSRFQSVSNCSLNEDFTDHLQKFYKRLSLIEYHINNTLNEFNSRKILSTILEKYFTNCSIPKNTKPEGTEIIINEEMKRVIESIFGKNPDLEKFNPVNRTRCPSNYRNLIDVRATGSENCGDSQGKKKRKKKRPQGSFIEPRNNFDPAENSEYEDSDENFESTTLHNLPVEVTEEISTETHTTNNYDAT